jgi:hypothetical protein
MSNLDPFGSKIEKEAWITELREGAKFKYYCEQFRLATQGRAKAKEAS